MATKEERQAAALGFGAVTAVCLVVVLIVLALMYGLPQYYVYTSRLSGIAKLAEAESGRQTTVRTAQAKKDAAVYEAEAEIERAKGVAAANRIIGNSLHENEEYLRWLWIETMKEGKDGKTIVYIPTEAGLPILEAGRVRGLGPRREGK